MAAETLPDDVILQILAHVPDAPSLLRFAATCKRWRALVADPSFLRRRWPEPAYFLLGSFAPKKLNRGDELEGWTPRSALAAGHRLLSSFVSDATALPADYVWPLTSHSHDGLLLLRLLNHSLEQIGGIPLAVCSLHAGTCDVLPPFQRYIHCIGHAVVTCRQSSFKVLMIEQGENKTGYVLHTFVAGQPSWNAPTKAVSTAALGSLMHNDAVVCQGTANWLFSASSSFHVLHVDAQTGRFSSTQLTSPIDSWSDLDLYVQHDRSRLATTTDGKLLSLCLYDAGLELVEIWTQPEPAARQQADWTRTGVIHLKQVVEQPQRRQVPYIWLGGTCGNGKLLITLAHRHAYIANLQTGTMQEVSSCSITRGVVCMEIDWTTFFMARLACTNQRP